MNTLVYMGHPAHFYLYKNAITNWRSHGHNVEILIKKKDILQQLLDNQGWNYHNILAEGRKNTKMGMAWGTLKRTWRLLCFCLKHKTDILTGTSVENSFIGPLLRIPVINCNEDDAIVVPLYAKLSYPCADVILNPTVCNSGKWDSKSIKYPSYQELAYLHPHHFVANRAVVEQYGIDTEKPYFVLRFASLKAHHDSGIRGINTEIAQHLIDRLRPHGQIYITSERPLEPQFEVYRIHINPLDMHHVMAFASLYLGDSQTMAAEAGVLGTPFVRFNDFVGRIGYLRELEDHYLLGYGVHATPLDADSPIRRLDGSVQSSGTDALYETVDSLLALSHDERTALYQQRRAAMLSEKIDYAQYLTWFVEHYPESVSAFHHADSTFWAQFGI